MEKMNFAFFQKLACVAICALVVAPPFATAADTPAVRLLLDRAQTQASSGHLDIAIATWKQVLAADPNNVEALRGLATAEAQSSHPTESQQYLDRLRRAGAPASVIAQIQAIQPRPSDDAMLREAGRLTQAGQYSAAMAIYRKLYGNNPPTGEIALIYYDTMAAQPAERKNAIEALRRLSQRFQDDERYSITLGRVLTYDAPTRAEGIAILQRYPNSLQAQNSLQQAQLWNERGQTARITIPNAQAGADSVPAPVQTSEIALGYRELNANNLTSAESHFQASLAREASKGDAHAGLGYVRMRQQDFPAAVREFEQAQQGGIHDARMMAAFETSRFWTRMAEAGRSADAGRYDEALAGYREALTLKPGNADALNGLGGTLLRAGRASEAIPYLSRAAHSGGSSQQAASAWRNLFVAQSQASLPADAIQTAEHIPADQRALFEHDPDFLGTLAADYTAVGNQAQSEKLLRQALAPFQDGTRELSTVQRLQYASLLVAAKRYNTATLSYHRVLADAPDNVDAWRGLVNAEHQGGRDQEALASLRQMPPAVLSEANKDAGFLSLTASIYQSQGQIEAARTALEGAIKAAPSMTLRLQQASLEMAGNNKPAAVRLYAQLVDENPQSTAAWLGWLEALHAVEQDREALHQVSAMPEDVSAILGQNDEFLQTLASIYNSVGDQERAIAVMARLDGIYAERGEDLPPAVALQEGWLSLQSGDNARLSRQIQRLAATEGLTPDQQNQLAQLWANWAVQRSSALTRIGNTPAAEAVLAAALRAFPDNIQVNNSLAGAYLQNGNPKQAVTLYARQNIATAEEDICIAAVNAAIAANDRRQSEEWLTSTMNRFGRDPKVLELAARFEQQRGDRRKAAEYYRAALQATGPPSVDDLLGTSAPVSAAGSEVSARRELFQMLAPGSATVPNVLPAPAQANTASARESLWPSRNDAIPAPAASAPQSRDSGDSLAALPLPPLSPRSERRQSNTPSQAALAEREPALAPSSPSASIWPVAPASASSPATPPPSRSRTAALEPLPAGTGASSARPTQQTRLDSLEPLPQPAPAPAPALSSRFHPVYLEDSSSNALIEGVAPPQLAPLPTLTGRSYTPPAPPVSPARQLQQNLEALEASTSPFFGGNSAITFHSGQPGFDRMTIFGADIEQSAVIGMGTRLTVITRPVLLQSDAPQANATFQLGSLPLAALPSAQSSSGVGGEVQLNTRNFGAAVGYTPYGFLVSNVTGRLFVQPNAGPISFSFERQPIEDSQLSYAGLRDPGSIGPTYSGNIWGGVMTNAGTLKIVESNATSGWYAQMGGQYITGRHVQNNFQINGDAGAYWSVWQHPQYGKLTVGMNFFGMHYDNNQRQYTYGNGGYFSPSAYLLGSVPVTFDGVQGKRFHYQIVGSIGLQAFQENSSPFFPLDPSLQTSALGGYLPQHTDISENYNLAAETSYLITEHWHVNGFFSTNNTRGYNNDSIGFSLRYAFHPQSFNLDNGPTGLGSSRGLRPVALP